MVKYPIYQNDKRWVATRQRFANVYSKAFTSFVNNIKSQAIEIELFMDFLDPNSRQAYNILKKVVAYYQGKVQSIWLILTLDISNVTNSICQFDNVDEPFKVPLSWKWF